MVTMSIGDYMFERIRNIREDNEYTQEYIASYLKINRVVYNRYETGVREIPVSILIKLADYYNVSIDYLLNRTNNKQIKKW